MPDPREAIVRMLRNDFQRSTRFIPKERTGQAWTMIPVSSKLWCHVYPKLSYMQGNESTLVIVWIQWELNLEAKAWQMLHWCVVEQVEEDQWRALTKFMTKPFGEAVPVEVSDAPLMELSPAT